MAAALGWARFPNLFKALTERRPNVDPAGLIREIDQLQANVDGEEKQCSRCAGSGSVPNTWGGDFRMGCLNCDGKGVIRNEAPEFVNETVAMINRSAMRQA